MAIYKDTFHVRFLDVDNNNKLKITSLINYFQEIGGEHSSSAGFGLYDIPNIGFAWILVGWSIEIYDLPKWNDTVFINTWHKGNNGPFSYRDFEAYVDNKLIAVGSSKWVSCDVKTGSVLKLSKELVQDFQTESKSALECEFKKIKEPEKYVSSFEYTVLRHDIDTNNHMNNSKYIGLAFEALPEDIYCKTFSNIEVMYKSAVTLGNKIVCLYSEINKNEHIITIKSEDLSKVYSIVRLISN